MLHQNTLKNQTTIYKVIKTILIIIKNSEKCTGQNRV